jgi:hypothetical protein
VRPPGSQICAGVGWSRTKFVLASGLLQLGKLTFQIGDALLGVFRVHQQMVSPGSRYCRKSRTSASTTGRPLVVEVFFTKSVPPPFENLLDRLVRRATARWTVHRRGHHSFPQEQRHPLPVTTTKPRNVPSVR